MSTGVVTVTSTSPKSPMSEIPPATLPGSHLVCALFQTSACPLVGAPALTFAKSVKLPNVIVMSPSAVLEVLIPVPPEILNDSPLPMLLNVESSAPTLNDVKFSPSFCNAFHSPACE